MPPPPEKSEYLASDFKSTTLTIPQLRSILLEYGVPAPAVAKKGDLVILFEEKVRSQADKILSAGRVKASNKGITVISENGSETASVAEVPAKRRGRPRKTATAEPEVVELEAEPPAKKRRGRPKKEITVTSTEPEEDEQKPATPRKPRASSRVTPVIEIPSSSVILGSPVVPMVKEEEDAGDEAEEEDLPSSRPGSARKGKGRAPASGYTQTVPSSSRRRIMDAVSDNLEARGVDTRTPAKTPSKSRSSTSLRRSADVKQESEAEDKEPAPKSVKKTPRRSAHEDPGAFSDYNPFQSGSEAAAERERRRRRSSIGLSQRAPRQPRFSEPAPKPATPTGILRRVGPSRESLRSPASEQRDVLSQDRDAYTAEDYNREVEAFLDLDRQSRPQERVADLADEPAHTSLIRQLNKAVPVTTSPLFTLPMAGLLLALLAFLGNYKSHSTSLGFCDTANHTNDLILNRQSKLDDAKACIARKANLALDDPEAAKYVHCDVSALPLIPVGPRPTSCTPCPAHAVCQDGALVACEPEYLLSAHPLAFLSPVFDGLPYVGPRAFPPKCLPDTARKRMVGDLAMAMEKELAKARGDIVCAGVIKNDDKRGDGAKYGVTEATLKERFAARRDTRFSREMFDEIFDAALNDLVQHDDVVETIDVEGISWYTASREVLSISCKAKLELFDLLRRWKSQLGSGLALVALIGWLRSTVLRRKEEKYRAEELVQVVLKRLQDQEYYHYADPVTTVHPFIPPAQLRDLVLPPTGSKTSRSRLWQGVTDLVEANSNVAVREKEVKGELWKTWEWQGGGERRVTWEQ